jgi:hypothetical protein
VLTDHMTLVYTLTETVRNYVECIVAQNEEKNIKLPCLRSSFPLP